MENIHKLVTYLYSQDTTQAYQSLKKLEMESMKTSQVYSYIDELIQMINHDNSYIRTRGLTLVIYNSRWDDAHKIESILDSFLSHILDKKPIVARQVITLLPRFLEYKPHLKETVIKSLIEADTSQYSEHMQSLVDKDIQDVLKVLVEDALYM